VVNGWTVKVRVETYGCTMNQGEGAALAERLAALGHEVIEDATEADLVVLNTCTVIGETEARMVRRMDEITAQRKRLVVVGCMASAQPDQVVKHAPNAIILPPREYGRFTSIIEESIGQGSTIPMRLPSSITAVVPIAQGCMGACSYCITRFARGPLASSRPEDIIGSARSAVDKGARELLVTAQDTACYGRDIGLDIGSLLNSITSLPGEFMVRVGMMNPDSLAPVLPSFLSAWSSPKVYQFVHLPVQSGSVAVLHSMNRRYLPEQFTDLVATLRQASPDMVLSTDVITGYPGETDEDHRATAELLRIVRPDIVNITRFSPRQGTPAARACDQVPGWVSKERSRELTKLRFDIARNKNASMVGRRERVTITELGKGDTSIARTRSYRQVILPGKRDLGTILQVDIVDSAPTHLFGVPS
jgi:threonylcarbamoyladenosine tRNA methylthiotransferase CDKAL1